MSWAFIFEIYLERQRGVKPKNIKAKAMCKFAQLYTCHENISILIGQIRYFLTIRELYAHGICWLFHLPPSEILN